MKIIKGVNRNKGDKTYYKYWISLPKKVIEQAELLDKDLDVKVVGNKIIIGEKD